MLRLALVFCFLTAQTYGTDLTHTAQSLTHSAEAISLREKPALSAAKGGEGGKV